MTEHPLHDFDIRASGDSHAGSCVAESLRAEIAICETGGFDRLGPNASAPVVDVYELAPRGVEQWRCTGLAVDQSLELRDEVRCDRNFASLAVLRLSKNGGPMDVDCRGASDLDSSCGQVNVLYLKRDDLARAKAGERHELDHHRVCNAPCRLLCCSHEAFDFGVRQENLVRLEDLRQLHAARWIGY